MSHGIAIINAEKILDCEAIQPSRWLSRIMWFLLVAAVAVFVLALFTGYSPALLWGTYYVNFCFWTGLACGSVIVSAVFEIVKARWAPPVRRIAEAGAAFLPVAFVLFLLSWFGSTYLFSWAQGAMPGREWWMRPGFVYIRFAVFFLILFGLMINFVRFSLRGDLGLLHEKYPDKPAWHTRLHKFLISGWSGSKQELSPLREKISFQAPLLVVVYVVIYSLFAFEMLMGMDAVWFSNVFGAIIFIGNIYAAWAGLAITALFFAGRSREYSGILSTQQLWDLGKLVFGFSMLWADLVFGQFIVQWYGNLPEETHWMMTRVRLEPWKWLSWFTFSCAFLIPFILLLSRDLKKTPLGLAAACSITLVGLWFSYFMIIMPQLSPGMIPALGADWLVNVSITLGFMAAYFLSIQAFLARFPFAPIAHLTAADRH